MVQKNIELKGAVSRSFLVDLNYTKNNKKKPVVIFCHGYKGYKDWGAWNLMATEFAKQDLFFLKFNFSHNGGTVKQPIDFPDLKAFGHNTYTKELLDLQSVLDWLSTNEQIKEEADLDNITLIGHSRGAGIVVIKAAEELKIKNVVTWNGVSDYKKRFPTGFKLFWWKLRGVGYIKNARTKQNMPHYYSFYKDFLANEDRLTIEKQVQKMQAKHLIVQAIDDETVKKEEAYSYKAWNPKAELFEIANTNHSFDCVQPYTAKQIPEALQTVVDKTISFINE